MNIKMKQIGDDLEVECCGCGEPIIVSDGDSMNFRTSEIETDDGFIPMPMGFLCVPCNKKENGDNFNSVEFHRMTGEFDELY